MSERRYLRAGIIGGMGPAATVRLYQLITEFTPVSREQDHIPLIIDSAPQVPDRTAALLAGGEDPLDALVASARRLVAAGADFLAIPCNTAHAWYDRIAAAVDRPVLNLIRMVAEAAGEKVPAGGIVGVLATRGTVATGLYQKALSQAHLRPLVADQAGQEKLMEAIGLIKLGGEERLRAAREVVLQQAEALRRAGAQCVILGCTDLSVVMDERDAAGWILDSVAVLARRIVAVATGAVALR